MLFIVLVQMHFIQRKQFNETNVTSHAFQQISYLKIFPELIPLATESAVVGHTLPTGLQLDHAVLSDNFRWSDDISFTLVPVVPLHWFRRFRLSSGCLGWFEIKKQIWRRCFCGIDCLWSNVPNFEIQIAGGMQIIIVLKTPATPVSESFWNCSNFRWKSLPNHFKAKNFPFGKRPPQAPWMHNIAHSA